MAAGRSLLIASLQGGTKPKIDSFLVSPQANFKPDPTVLNPLPSPIYTGTQSQIMKTVINPDEVILHTVLDNQIELSSVGSILLRSGGQPFAWIVLRKAVPKKKVDNVKHFAGSLFHQSLVLRIPKITQLLDLSNNPDFYSKPKVFEDFNTLPRPIEAGAREVLVEKDTRHYFNRNKMVWMVSVANTWFGIPNFKSFDDPEFGVIGGGQVGDGYK